MKSFDIPSFYRSPIISHIKEIRKLQDKLKKDFSPTILDFGPVEFNIARHFGFCYGVENAIEIIYRIVNENPDKRIYLLSEMIHNPQVNQDLIEMGVQFIQDTSGNEQISWDSITSDDIVVIPAFGTSIEMEKKLLEKGISIEKYNTTCPFVERVWKRSSKLGEDNYSIVIHGKKNHEETRATFSHSKENAPSIIIENIDEAKILANIIRGIMPISAFDIHFPNRCSVGFDPTKDLKHIGVVNQTTMLATETQAIAQVLKEAIVSMYGADAFADTRDTLCYATSDNQTSVIHLLNTDADIAIVVGGYNSSNTSHLVELCEEKLPTYYISSADEIVSINEIFHFDIHTKQRIHSSNFLADKRPIKILITSGASCPDATIDAVIQKIISFYPSSNSIETVLDTVKSAY